VNALDITGQRERFRLAILTLRPKKLMIGRLIISLRTIRQDKKQERIEK